MNKYPDTISEVPGSSFHIVYQQVMSHRKKSLKINDFFEDLKRYKKLLLSLGFETNFRLLQPKDIDIHKQMIYYYIEHERNEEANKIVDTLNNLSKIRFAGL